MKINDLKYYLNTVAKKKVYSLNPALFLRNKKNINLYLPIIYFLQF